MNARWVNAEITVWIALDVSPDATDAEKLEAAEAAWEEREWPEDASYSLRAVDMNDEDA